MDLGAIFLIGVGRRERNKALLLSLWFFLTVATLWILKPVRVASLLVHLGATETPYVRLAGVATIGVVVMLYSMALSRLSRPAVVRWSTLLFAGLLVAFWAAIQIGGAWLGAQRPFVWAVYVLVEIYSVVMIGIFWTYTNDVCTQEEADKLYGMIGLGGTLGGVAGGAFVDAFAKPVGPVHLLLVCAGLVLATSVLGAVTESVLKPPPRKIDVDKASASDALAGASEVKKSRYLMLLVAIVVAYEFTATLTDFGVNVVFERAFTDEVQLTKMYGRLGWVVSVTAVVAQIVLVPLLLPAKRAALLLSPIAMLAGAVGALILPVVATAFFLAAADRGLNYSLQQSVKESLYVPLTDSQKYRAKAFIDMFVDRAAKALAAFALIGLIHFWGAAVRPALVVGVASIAVWIGAAARLGARFPRRAKPGAEGSKGATVEPTGSPAMPGGAHAVAGPGSG